MRLFKSAVPVLAVAMVVDVIASNLSPVNLALMPFTTEATLPLGLALLLVGFLGFVIGGAYGRCLGLRERRRASPRNMAPREAK